MNGVIVATFSEKDGPKMVMCTSKDGIGSDSGITYRTEQESVIYESSEHVTKRLDGLIKSICLRALCCEYVGPRTREGKLAFRCGGVYALAVVFQVLDKKARGLHRAFALIYVDFELSTLMRNTSFIAATLRQIACSIKSDARKVFHRESRHRTHSPHSESLRTLCQLLGRADLHLTLHQHLTWLLHTTHYYVSVNRKQFLKGDVSQFPFTHPEFNFISKLRSIDTLVSLDSPTGRRKNRSLEDHMLPIIEEQTTVLCLPSQRGRDSTESTSRQRQVSLPVCVQSDTAALLHEIDDNIVNSKQNSPQLYQRTASEVSASQLQESDISENTSHKQSMGCDYLHHTTESHAYQVSENADEVDESDAVTEEFVLRKRPLRSEGNVIKIAIPRGNNNNSIIARKLSFRSDSNCSPTRRRLNQSEISAISLRGIRSAIMRFEIQNGQQTKLFKTLLFHIVSGDQIVVTSEDPKIATKATQTLSLLLPPHQRSTIEFSNQYIPVYRCRLLGMETDVFLNDCCGSLPEGCVHLEIGATVPLMALVDRNCERWDNGRFNEHNCAYSLEIDKVIDIPSKPSSELMFIQRTQLRFSRLGFLFTSLARSTRTDRSSFDFTDAERCNILSSLSIQSRSPHADAAVLRCLGAGHPSRRNIALGNL